MDQKEHLMRCWILELCLISFLLISVVLADDISTISTFECTSIYHPSAQKGDCQVFYKNVDKDNWKQAFDLDYDSRDQEYRGSIVGLKAKTEYDIKLKIGSEKIFGKAFTLDENFPVGKSSIVSNGTKPLLISESGTSDAYHLFAPQFGTRASIDVRNSEDYTAVIDADYVIVSGLELRNAAIHGILIKEGRHHIIIEDCHITFWGRIGGPRSFGNEGAGDSGIYARTGAGNLIVQRNLIHNPRGCSNNWETGHPSGPQAISLINSSGGNIIRYNDMLSTFDHSFNDIFGGGSNFSDKGSPNRDSDIYGNIFRAAHDDAIESEGANMNVRIWGNYIHDTFQHIATASTSKGPLYIFRNVFGTSRKNRKFPGGSMIKTGMRGEFGGGKKFVFHNTALQPDGALNVFSNHPDPNCMTRNNIFDCAGRLASTRATDTDGDYDYDLFTGMVLGNAKEPHGIKEIPWFIESYYLEFYPKSSIETVKWGKRPVKIGDTEKILTDPVITVPNPIIDAGIPLPNFNDNFTGDGPDLGAFEIGCPPLKFGRHANGAQLAPWERY